MVPLPGTHAFLPTFEESFVSTFYVDPLSSLVRLGPIIQVPVDCILARLRLTRLCWSSSTLLSCAVYSAASGWLPMPKWPFFEWPENRLSGSSRPNRRRLSEDERQA